MRTFREVFDELMSLLEQEARLERKLTKVRAELKEIMDLQDREKENADG